MNKRRIIAAHAGCGKSYFCKRITNAIDFVIMPFKYSNFYELSKEHEGRESIKASEDLDFIIDWQDRYYEALIDTYNKYPDEVIVIPAEPNVLMWLYFDRIPFTLVYPNENAKEEYCRRYIERGNSETFLHIFIDAWTHWMNQLKSIIGCEHIVLEDNQYLADVIEVSDFDVNKIIPNKEQYIYKTYFNK